MVFLASLLSRDLSFSELPSSTENFGFIKRFFSLFLSLVILSNVSLLGSPAFAQDFQLFEVGQNAVDDQSPETGDEFALVSVVVDDQLLADAQISTEVSNYCRRVQEAIGAACMIMDWEGERPDRLVETFQHQFFEGANVDGGLGKLVGVVLIGDVPLPVVQNADESFASVFPYVDLVQPAYVYQPDQDRFQRSSVAKPQAELWHGVINPPGSFEEKKEALMAFFQKNARFYAGDEEMSVFSDQIGFHDHFWENDAFDNEAKRLYLQRMKSMDRLIHYRYSGDWLAELSGEAVDRFQQLISKEFDESVVAAPRVNESANAEESGFDVKQIAKEAGDAIDQTFDDNPGLEASDPDRLDKTVPDSYSPGPIRNFLKEYVHVVQRYVSGTSDLFASLGRRQDADTLASLIAKQDRFSSAVIFLVMEELEQYILEQARLMATNFELVSEYEQRNAFSTPGDFKYDTEDYERYANGRLISSVNEAEDCSIERGSLFRAEDGELGRAISLNRKDNPLTALDIADAEDDDEIEKIYKKLGYCSYQVKDRCVPAASRVPLFDPAASEIFEGDNDYRRCFAAEGRPIPEGVEGATFHEVSSVIHHAQPTGELVRAMLSAKLAHYFPIDAVRHVSFFWGGIGQYADSQVARLEYPNFFSLLDAAKRADGEAQENFLQSLRALVDEKEKELRRSRVEANWQRFARLVALSTPGGSRPDFWNYLELPGLDQKFQAFRADVLTLLRDVLDPDDQLEDFELVERYLTGDIPDDLEQDLVLLFEDTFPSAMAKESLDLKCSYSFDLPPVDVSFKIPKVDPQDVFAGDFSEFEFPKFNPPSLSRSCSNKLARSTDKQVKSLRAFYEAKSGIQVDLAFLHKADGFREVLDPVGVVLFFTPSVPPSVNQQRAIAIFEKQRQDLLSGSQPITNLRKLVEPVQLVLGEELQGRISSYEQLLSEALNWLSLDVEEKHRQGLSKLSEDRVMMVTVLDGDAEEIRFGFENLDGVFEDDAGISSSGDDTLAEVQRRLDALKKKQEEDRKRRAAERRAAGEQTSACGDSVPLLQWPGAVMCWLDEIVAGPLIVPRSPDQETEDERLNSGSESLSGEPESSDSVVSADLAGSLLSVGGDNQELTILPSALSLRQQAVARLDVPLSTEVEWSASGAVRVVPQEQGEVAVLAEEVGVGTVIAIYEDDKGERQSVRAQVRVTDVEIESELQGNQDLVIGSNEVLDLQIQLVDLEGELSERNASLDLVSLDPDVLSLPDQVSLEDGKGVAQLRPGQRAGVARLLVGSDRLGWSAPQLIAVIAGEPAALKWSLADGIFGLDGRLRGHLEAYDAFGNLFTAEGMMVSLNFSGITVNGEKDQTQVLIAGGRAQVDLQILPNAEKAVLEAVNVDGFDNLQLPAAPGLDIRDDFRLEFFNVPQQVTAGSDMKVGVRVLSGDSPISLRSQSFDLQQEIAGEVLNYRLEMQGQTGFVTIPVGGRSGSLKLSIADEDFGSVFTELEVLGDRPVSLNISRAELTDEALQIEVLGRDELGNVASLKDQIISVEVIGDGARSLLRRSFAVESERFELDQSFKALPARARVQVRINAIDADDEATATRTPVLRPEQIRDLSWGTPYVVLGGTGMADHLVSDHVAGAMLYGNSSQVQAVTAEGVAHRGAQKSLRIFPTAVLQHSDDIQLSVIWEDLKPVVVANHVDEGELGRLLLNPKDLRFVEADQLDDARLSHRGQAVLVAETATYVAESSTRGVLQSDRGEELLQFDNNRVFFDQSAIQTELIVDEREALILVFASGSQVLARWTLFFDEDRVHTEQAAALLWRASEQSGRFQQKQFYAGSSTAASRGIMLLDRKQPVRYAIGEGDPALDDADQNNGQGFKDADKMVLNFLSGSSVGESTRYQSEGIITLGDPVISLRQVQQRVEGSGLKPVIPEGSSSVVQDDYSLGQLVYKSDAGEIQHLLRLDVEQDGDDDLLVGLQRGGSTVLDYLESYGEGQRWGKVTGVLDLGEGVQDIQVIEAQHLLVLFESGKMLLEQNNQGKFIRQEIDTSSLGEDLSFVEIAVRDMDGDSIDDLVLLTGSYQLWVWYGSFVNQSYRLGVRNEDRVLLHSFGVRLQDPQHLLSSLWIKTSNTPQFEVGCRDQRLVCQARYFRGVLLDSEERDDEEVDRLQALIDEAEGVSFRPVEEAQAETNYLLRLDKDPREGSSVDVEFLTRQEGSQLAFQEAFDVQVNFTPRSSEDQGVLRFDPGQAFALEGRPSCEICSDDLQLVNATQSLWSLEGSWRAGQRITIRFRMQSTLSPDFSLQLLESNGDGQLDVGVNVDGNSSGKITLLESTDTREYVQKTLGDAPDLSAGPATQASKLSELMKGIGIEGKSQNELKDLLLQQQDKMSEHIDELFDDVHQDENGDGYPDAFQENSFLFPESILRSQPDQLSQSVPRRVSDWLSSTFFPSAQAQSFDLGQNLQSTQQLLSGVGSQVNSVIKALRCSRGCLPLPINFAFLAPGPINVFGSPAGFDPGIPIFGVSAAPFFVWPALVPYQATQFRLYLSPTLTMGVGMAVCVGPWLLGQCAAFAVPADKFGGEGICDATKQGLRSIVSQVQSAVGQVNAVGDEIEGAINQGSTGVVKAKVGGQQVQDAESILGVSLGGGVVDQKPVLDAKVNLSPVPKIFVDWWDKQFEEIVNSLTDLPDITVRVPQVQDGFGDAEYWDKIGERVTGDTFFNLQGIYDLVNALPIIRLKAQTLNLQIPWIEPGLLRRLEQVLYEFMYNLMLEVVAFMKSFNLPCNITVVRQELAKDLEKRIRGNDPEVNAKTQKELDRLSKALDAQRVDIDAANAELEKLISEKGFEQLVGDKRQQYFEQARQKQEKVDELQEQLETLEGKILANRQPDNILESFQLFGDVLRKTSDFWTEQITEFNKVQATQGLERESAEALRSCLALNLGVDLTVGVQEFIDSIRKNIEVLDRWKKFPRALAKYLNVVDFYIQEVIRILDEVTSVVLKWWSEFEQKLDLWIDAINSFREFVALIRMLLDILKGYNKKCGLCSSDRLTLKDLLLKVLFGAVPNLPIIDFPTFPDITLDFSKVDLGMEVTVPVFDVKTVDLKVPSLPEIKFPRFPDVQLSALGELSLGFQVNLPEVPLVIPEPPILPPLPKLPSIPEVNLPNLPPAPEVPQVLEQLLPLMEIISTILDIWCLVNKALIPIPEQQLKTQIENLTNRSLNLILPIDLLLDIQPFPGDLLSKNVPFDQITVESQLEAAVDLNVFPDGQATIDQVYHEPINAFLNQLNGWVKELQDTGSSALDLEDQLQGTLNQFKIDESLEFQETLEAEAGFQQELDNQFPGLPQAQLQQLDGLKEQVSDRFAVRERSLESAYDQFQGSLDDYRLSFQGLLELEPDDLMASLGELDQQHALAASGQSLLRYEQQSERLADLQAEDEVLELSLIDKPRLLAQVQDQGQGLRETIQELGGEQNVGIQELGTAVVRGGQVRRIQDYPLGDPEVLVWDDDVFLAYEGALYVKPSDGSFRASKAYTGGVKRADVADFQRSKVHLLQVKPIARDNEQAEEMTMRWSWDSPELEQVELTIWDSVAQAQQRDLSHQRYYVNRKADFSQDQFQVISGDRDALVEEADVEIKQETKLRFGDDVITLPAGVSIRLVSLIDPSIEIDGSGQVVLELVSERAWDIELGEETLLGVSGRVQMNADGPGSVQLPALQQRPYVRQLSGEINGSFLARVDVLRGESVPAGEFYALRSSVLKASDPEMSLTLPPGMILPVDNPDQWVLESGSGRVVVSSDRVQMELDAGDVLLDHEVLQAQAVIDDRGVQRRLLPQQSVQWRSSRGPRVDITLPRAHYYGRIRDPEGLKGFSPIVYASARQVLEGQSQFVPGRERITAPLYTPIEIDARDYFFGSVREDDLIWRLDGEVVDDGYVFEHPGFSRPGVKNLELLIRDGDQVTTKSFDLDILVPELEIDEDLLSDERVLKIQTDPAFPNIPLGVVGSRDGVEDWLLAPAVRGVRQGARYLTDANGLVEFPSFESLSGKNIIIEDGFNVARLFPNGRVVLQDAYVDVCDRQAVLDTDGYLKFQVSCFENDSLIDKFETRMLPHLDSDVQIVDEFLPFHRGVVVRTLQQSLELIELGSDHPFAPGGVQLNSADDSVSFVLHTDGKLELSSEALVVNEKAFDDPSEALVWQIRTDNALLAEVQVLGPGEKVSIVDPVSREQLEGDADNDGMLDSWEAFYFLESPDEDRDLDGVTNLIEFLQGSNPLEADSDGDGISDLEDVNPVSSEIARKKLLFSDIDQESPYFESIDALLQLGFIKGYEDGTFRPDQAVTRAETLKILMSVIRCENCEFPLDETRTEFAPSSKSADDFLAFHDGLFANEADELEDENKIYAFGRDQLLGKLDSIRSYLDVEGSDWFYHCVEIATDLGIVNGYRGLEDGVNALGSFIPTREVNIAELMKMVIEAMGDRGKESERVFGPADGWWNAPDNNYLAKAEEELQLLLSSDDYSDPLRFATRAEVAYAAHRVLVANGTLDLDEDGVVNGEDSCPCTPGEPLAPADQQGCPAADVPFGPVFDPRRLTGAFEGIEITQLLTCKCLVVVDADLLKGSQFYAVITGRGADSNVVLKKSNVVGGD